MYISRTPLTLAVLLALAGNAQAGLVARSLDGDASTAEAYYDTALNITWLKDWNLAAGTAFDDGASTTDGLLTGLAAGNWAASLSIGGYSDWRLPTFNSSRWGYDVNYVDHELGHLWYTTLGNSAGSLSNTGPFTNLAEGLYWDRATDVGGSQYAFMTSVGYQGDDMAANRAVAVHAGDIGTAVREANHVPEPTSLALGGVALAGLAAARRRRPAVELAGPTPRRF